MVKLFRKAGVFTVNALLVFIVFPLFSAFLYHQLVKTLNMMYEVAGQLMYENERYRREHAAWLLSKAGVEV